MDFKIINCILVIDDVNYDCTMFTDTDAEIMIGNIMKMEPLCGEKSVACKRIVLGVAWLRRRRGQFTTLT